MTLFGTGCRRRPNRAKRRGADHDVGNSVYILFYYATSTGFIFFGKR